MKMANGAKASSASKKTVKSVLKAARKNTLRKSAPVKKASPVKTPVEAESVPPQVPVQAAEVMPAEPIKVTPMERKTRKAMNGVLNQTDILLFPYELARRVRLVEKGLPVQNKWNAPRWKRRGHIMSVHDRRRVKERARVSDTAFLNARSSS